MSSLDFIPEPTNAINPSWNPTPHVKIVNPIMARILWKEKPKTVVPIIEAAKLNFRRIRQSILDGLISAAGTAEQPTTLQNGIESARPAIFIAIAYA